MFKYSRPVWAEINLDNLVSNVKEIRNLIGDKELIAVVKADGYGHGAVEIANTLVQEGIDRLAVSMLSEAIELRFGGVKKPILILGFTPPGEFEKLIELDIEQTIYDFDMARLLSETAVRLGKIGIVHIKVDTGMGRIGFLPNENSISTILKIVKLEGLEIRGIFSHFSTSDELDKTYSKGQIEKFNWVINRLEEERVHIKLKHLSNSAGIMDIKEAYYNAVRAGIILYGYYPSKEVMRDKLRLKPVLCLKANIIHIKEVKAGEYISYGRKYRTSKVMIIATLPVGYADGYSRKLSNNGFVIVKGCKASIVGTICMDQFMIDVTNIPDLKVGDEVIIIGTEGALHFTAEDMADSLGTISYEVICGISKRVPRVYIENGVVKSIKNYI
ncbi:MAG TPA: alanine racemase [Clostridiaceae bacterium]